MILLRQLNRKVPRLAPLVVIVATAIAHPVSLSLAADEAAATDRTDLPKELPRSGVLEVVISADGTPTTTKSVARALSRLEAIGDKGSATLLGDSLTHRTRTSFKTPDWEGEAPAEPQITGASARQEPRPPSFETASSQSTFK